MKPQTIPRRVAGHRLLASCVRIANRFHMNAVRGSLNASVSLSGAPPASNAMPFQSEIKAERADPSGSGPRYPLSLAGQKILWMHQ